MRRRRRPSWSGRAESRARGASAITDPTGLEEPIQRIRTGGPRRPIAIALLLLAGLLLAVWQPWGSGTSTATPRASTEAIRRPAAAASVTPGDAAPGAADQTRTDGYVSLTDNEWTVVALLAPGGPASTEEPAMPHAPAWSPDGPFAVLQQGASVATAPGSRSGVAAPSCTTTIPPRFRPAVLLPANRVAYLGVTFPGMDPATRVTASPVGGGPSLLRMDPVVVRLAGGSADRRFAIPSSGPGGAILFGASPPLILPTGAYRFDITVPGLAADRSVFACIVA